MGGSEWRCDARDPENDGLDAADGGDLPHDDEVSRHDDREESKKTRARDLNTDT